MIKNNDPHSQIENNERPDVEHPNESDSEEGETNKNFAFSNFVPQMLPDETAEGINSLHSKQSKIFNMVYTWVKDSGKYDGHNVEPMYMFLPCSNGTGKSYLVKVIYNVISKSLLCCFESPEKLRFLLLSFTEISAVNIGIKPFILILDIILKQSYLV